MKYEFSAWPTDTNHIAVDKIDPETGRVLRTKLTRHKRSWGWWKEHGFFRMTYGKTVTIARA